MSFSNFSSTHQIAFSKKEKIEGLLPREEQESFIAVRLSGMIVPESARSEYEHVIKMRNRNDVRRNTLHYLRYQITNE